MKQKLVMPLLYYRRQILVCLIVGMFLVSMGAFCATAEDVAGARGMTKTIFNMIDDIFDLTAMEDLENLLVVDYHEGTLRAGGITFSSLAPVVSVMHRAFQNLGVMLLIVHFGVGIVESISFSQMYVEKVVRQFVFLCVGIVLVSHSMDLVYGMGNIFSALIQGIVDHAEVAGVDMSSGIMDLKMAIYEDCNVSSGKGFKAAIADSITNLSASVSYLIQLFIPSLISRLAGLVVSVMCWSRFIELTVMAVVSPLTVCDISSGAGMNSNAVRGIRNVAALGLSGAVIMLSVFICQQIQYGILSANVLDGVSFMSCVWKEIVVGIVEVGLVVRAPNLAKQILGMG